MLSLHDLVWANDYDKLSQKQWTKFELNVVDELGESLLHYAVRKNNYKIVRWLLSCGLDPNVKNNYQSTPLHIAAACSSIGIVVCLIMNGADMSLKDINGWTPIDCCDADERIFRGKTKKELFKTEIRYKNFIKMYHV